jgi:hypothetical protein
LERDPDLSDLGLPRGSMALGTCVAHSTVSTMNRGEGDKKDPDQDFQSYQSQEMQSVPTVLDMEC